MAGLAEAYLSLRNFPMAEQTFKLLIPLVSPKDPKMDIYLLDLADVYACSKRTQRAEALCNQVVAAHLVPVPHNVTSSLLQEIIQIGQWYLERHKYIKAEYYLQTAINLCSPHYQLPGLLSPDNPDTKDLKEFAERALISCCIGQRQFKKAKILMSKYHLKPEDRLQLSPYFIRTLRGSNGLIKLPTDVIFSSIRSAAEIRTACWTECIQFTVKGTETPNL